MPRPPGIISTQIDLPIFKMSTEESGEESGANDLRICFAFLTSRWSKRLAMPRPWLPEEWLPALTDLEIADASPDAAVSTVRDSLLRGRASVSHPKG